MAKAVKDTVKIGEMGFPGYIQTSRDDILFLKDVMLRWAKLPIDDMEKRLRDAVAWNLLCDRVFRTGGFLVSNDEMTIILIKIDVGRWVVVGMNFEEMESLVKSIESRPWILGMVSSYWEHHAWEEMDKNKIKKEMEMVEAVNEKIVVNGVVFPCHISTNLSDVNFLKSVMLMWGQWPSSVVAKHISDSAQSGELEDARLRKDGYFVAENEGDDIGVTLLKADVGKWVVLGMEFEAVEVFVDECGENMEINDTVAEQQQVKKSVDCQMKLVVLVSAIYSVITVFYFNTHPSFRAMVAFGCASMPLMMLALLGVALYSIKVGRSAKK